MSEKKTTLISDPKPFYGWWIVAAGTAVLFVSSGIGFYGHGVILDPLRTLHEWSKATVSSAITLYFLTAGIMGMIIGRQVDRYGQKWVLILGSVTICAGFTFLGYIRTVSFWSIVIAFLLALTGQIAFLVHQVSFLSDYLGVSGAATAVSITAAASIAGRLFLGTIVDRCDKRHVIMVCFLIQGLAMITLAHYNHVVILYLGTLAFGLTMGSIIMMQSLIIGECFGLVSFATVSGFAGLFTMSGAAFGPTIAAVIYDATQSYQAAFTIFAVMSIVAIVVIYFAGPPDLV